LISDGDLSAAITAALRGTGVHAVMGIGGAFIMPSTASVIAAASIFVLKLTFALSADAEKSSDIIMPPSLLPPCPRSLWRRCHYHLLFQPGLHRPPHFDLVQGRPSILLITITSPIPPSSTAPAWPC
jgi:hypothetical protein